MAKTISNFGNSTFYGAHSRTINLNPSFCTNEKIRKTNVDLKEIIRKINSSAPKGRNADDSVITTAKYLKKRATMKTLVVSSNANHHKSVEHCAIGPHVKVHAYLTSVNSLADIKPSIVSVPTHLLFTRSK